MNDCFAKFKLSGLLPYLYTRTKLRFFVKANSSTPDRMVTILEQNVSLSLIDLEQKYLAEDCIREPENLLVYRAIARAGLVNTFVDIGANCGHVALSIINDYESVLLFEPNPKLAALLRDLFKQRKNVEIRECAIVDEASIGFLTLIVPDDSSGLATLGGTHLSEQHGQAHNYRISATTLAAEVVGYDISKAYIKIDVEGFEDRIIQSAKILINELRPIVGFEALSKEAAIKCSKLFNNHVFYCARFDFLERGGALSQSVIGMLKSVIFGANINVIRLDNIDCIDLGNFSQIYAVPAEKAQDFEASIVASAKSAESFDLEKFRAWS